MKSVFTRILTTSFILLGVSCTNPTSSTPSKDINGSLVLIKKYSEIDRFYQVSEISSEGSFSFEQINFNDYRLAFFNQSKEDLLDGKKVIYNKNDNTSKRFAYLSYSYFKYEGDNINFPKLEINWEQNLEPNNISFDINEPILFSWSEVPDILLYRVIITDSNFKTIYKTNPVISGKFVWENQEKNKVIKKGQKYYFSVEVEFRESDDKLIHKTIGNSAFSMFEVK